MDGYTSIVSSVVISEESAYSITSICSHVPTLSTDACIRNSQESAIETLLPSFRSWVSYRMGVDQLRFLHVWPTRLRLYLSGIRF